MSRKTAKADLTPVRQRTQYTCMSTSMMMCLRALGHECDEDEVNKVMGARPMKGAAWEQALACAQHYGCRATLTSPSTVKQLKEWTDAGKPVMIAWNPEGREWSHASVVFDVDDDLNVYVADPNIPDPDETVRVVPKGEFYKKWYEKWPNYLVRRPAMMIDREITADGRQVMASAKRVASRKTAGVAKDFLDVESYEVDGSPRKRLTLTPITYSLDAWEDFGKDGAVALALGRESVNLSPQQFATFASDMKKALNWASRYNYRKRVQASQQKAAQWKPLFDGKGKKYITDDLRVYVSPEDVWETVRDRDIPDLHEVADPEMLADGIPELMDAYEDAARDYEKWVRQGWWPRPEKVQKWRIYVTHRPTKKNFESKGLYDSEREALRMANIAIPKIQARRRPRWLVPDSDNEAATMRSAKKNKRKNRTTEVRTDKKDPNKMRVEFTPGGGRNPHAQDALSRKTTRGHKRKERARNISRGHSRKQKHKGQRAYASAARVATMFMLKGEE